jgi:hypothetical protein
LILQRACYLSINPQKDETLETEKAQYYLPDGSTIEVVTTFFSFPLTPTIKLWTQQKVLQGPERQTYSTRSLVLLSIKGSSSGKTLGRWGCGACCL